MKTLILLRFAICLLIPALTSGCATEALWSEQTFDNFNEPANPPHLRLFRAEKKEDWLVVYDEHSERTELVKTRAYFLRANATRLERHHRPRFVRVRTSRGLTPVPVFLYPADASRHPTGGFYALSGTNGGSFGIFDHGVEIFRGELPVYNDGTGTMKRLALTPLAVGVDATIVGGCIAVIALEVCAGSSIGPYCGDANW
jgi:hypothetical protein